MDRSPFAQLPPELRCQIYELALLDADNVTTVGIEYSATFMREPNRPRALLYTCRKIRVEASLIYYKNIRFEMRDCLDMEPPEEWAQAKVLALWLQGLRQEDLRSLRKIHAVESTLWDHEVESLGRHWLQALAVVDLGPEEVELLLSVYEWHPDCESPRKRAVRIRPLQQ